MSATGLALWSPDRLMMPRSPRSIQRVLQYYLGATLTGLWLRDDLVVDGNGDVTSWPARIGSTATASAHLLNTATRTGKTVISDTDAENTRYLTTPSVGTVRCAIVVAKATGLPFSANRSLLQGVTESPFWIASGATWYENASLVHYTNGVRATTITEALSVYQADMPVTAMGTTGYVMGRAGAAAGNWLGALDLIAYATTVPSEAARLLYTAHLAAMLEVPV